MFTKFTNLSNSKVKKTNIGLSIVIVILLFVMFYIAPLRLDDWVWGSSVGIDRMKSGFADYNGRYISDLLVIVLLRIPVFLRVIFQMAVILGIVYFIYRIVKKQNIVLYLSIILLVFMPANIFSQTVLWISGFSNYAVSLLVILFFYDRCINVILEQKEITVLQLCFLCPGALAAQLILETGTIYLLVILIVTAVLYAVRFHKIHVKTILLLVFAIIGAVVMFSNGEYSAAVNGEDYKVIYINKGSFLENIKILFFIFRSVVLPLWIPNCGGMSVLASAVLIPYSLIMSTKFKKLNAVISFVFTLFFIYSALNHYFWDYNSIGYLVSEVVYILFIVFILYLITSSRLDKKEKQNTFVCALSQFFIIGPLVFVLPLAERCLLQSYVYWIILVCLMCGQMLEYSGVKKTITDGRFKIILPAAGIIVRILIVGVLLATLFGIPGMNDDYGMVLACKIYKTREEAVKQCIENGEKSIVIPNLPYDNICSRGTYVWDEYWIENYKRYYNIPSEVEIYFIN